MKCKRIEQLDFHEKEYRASTITKLEIFETYLTGWLPVFIKSGYYNKSHIYDFFAGPGTDAEGTKGSPLIIMDVLKKYKTKIQNNEINISILLNDNKQDKYIKLKQVVDKKKKEDTFFNDNSKINIEITNDDFDKLFWDKKDKISEGCNFLFFDQCGIKFIKKKELEFLNSIPATDFLLFVSSSYIWRFIDTPEFQQHFPGLIIGEDDEYFDVHRKIVEYFRNQLLPKDSELRLYPFSLKKGNNIYGLIFGSKHPLGIEKFLRIAWDKNKINGEANFDIDDDKCKKQRRLFGKNRLTKIEKFQQNLVDLILERKLKNNKDVYFYTLEEGHIPDHAREVVRNLKKSEKIIYKGHTLISYNQVCKKRNFIEYKVSDGK